MSGQIPLDRADDFALLRGHPPTAAVAWANGRPISRERLLADIHCWRARLPATRYVINLCTDRYGFAVGLLAALLNGQVTVLPPDARGATVRDLCAQYDSVALFGEAPPPTASGCAWSFDLAAAPVDDTAPPTVAGARLAVIVHTSGSSGKPVPHPKTWGALVGRARAVARRLDLPAGAGLKAVATVPAQHMYGLENTIMLPLQGGLALHAGRPFFAADVAAALAEGDTANLLVTTPIHLKALSGDALDYPRVCATLSSTAPLPAGEAQAAERNLHAPVLEIYGSTETGVVAMRRTAVEASWQPVDGLRVRAHDAGALVEEARTGAATLLEDTVEVAADGSFVLGPRCGDTVKIGGKRTSLAALNEALRAIPGVEDGVFYVPEQGARLVAFAVAPALQKSTILAALRAAVDPVFLPRPLVKVAALPRNATGKLPREALARLSDALPLASSES